MFVLSVTSVWDLVRKRVKIVTQARHALTANSKLGWAASETQFSYLHFYHTITKAVSKWSQTEQTQLVGWWNGYVFLKLLSSQFVSQASCTLLLVAAECCRAYKGPLV